MRYGVVRDLMKQFTHINGFVNVTFEDFNNETSKYCVSINPISKKSCEVKLYDGIELLEKFACKNRDTIISDKIEGMVKYYSRRK